MIQLLKKKLIEELSFLKLELKQKKTEVINLEQRIELFQIRIAEIQRRSRSGSALTAAALRKLERSSISFSPNDRHSYSINSNKNNYLPQRNRTGSECSSSLSFISSNSKSNKVANRYYIHKDHDERYSYIPKNSTSVGVGSYNVEISSFSDKGGTISRCINGDRDTYIKKTDAPGVGKYNVRNVERVKGGEFGETARVLKFQ